MNSQPRPHEAGVETIYPDPSLKPADAAYPPFADPSPAEQLRLGPWSTIEHWLNNVTACSGMQATRHFGLRRSVVKTKLPSKLDEFSGP
jgi:hypothetical protein